MNDTEQLFFAALVWALIAAAIARFIPNWPGRIAFFAITVGLPFWELPYGYYNFQKLCREEGKLLVYAEIAPQKSICVDYPFDSSARTLHRFGFASIESRDKKGEVIEFSGSASAGLSQSRKRSVSSEYCVTFLNNIRLPWRVNRHDFLVIRRSDGKNVARHSEFDWLGMWWQQAATPVLGHGGECGRDPVRLVMTALVDGVKKSKTE
jgi:hypothetical protein